MFTIKTLNIGFCTSEIPESDLNEARKAASSKFFTTIDGSSQFMVMVFRPNSPTFSVARRLCTCAQCIHIEYGTCELFEEFALRTGDKLPLFLRSENATDMLGDNDYSSTNTDFIVPGSYVAVAAEEKSIDTIYIIKVKEVATTILCHCIIGCILCFHTVHYDLQMKNQTSI